MLKRLLITGAAGGLGRMVRPRLAHVAKTLRLSDIVAPAPAGPDEETVICDLGDAAAVHALVDGCDGVLHLGGMAVEADWDTILRANIEGVRNLYEAARKTGKPRILLASSNHAIGFHRQDKRLDASAPTRPDGLYGLSKCFAESMASMYHDKFGVETAILRIGSCLPEPVDLRMLSTWLSPDDFIALIDCVFRAPRLGCPIIYGASDNDASWWDNSSVAWLGWRPKDNAEAFRAKVGGIRPEDPLSVEATRQGGRFAAQPLIET